MKAKQFISLSAIALNLSFAACTNNNGSEWVKDADPIVLRSEYKAKTESNTSFAINIFNATIEESAGDNIFISPYSINTALSMLWNGAAAQTADELQLALGNESYTRDQINDYSKTLTDALLKVDKSTDLKIANSIWADKTTPFLQTFVNTNQTYYNAAVRNVDFSSSATFNTINDWCKEQTNGRITKITDGMTRDTKFALINAIYFNGKWKKRFEKKNTQLETFTNHQGHESKVNMMNQEETLLYQHNENGWHALKLDYGNRAFSMVVWMPHDEMPLDEKLPTLTDEFISQTQYRFQDWKVKLKMPRFTEEYSYKLHESILRKMGIEQVFSITQADLREMCIAPMFVDCVMHKSSIEISEEGTKATAVTSISGGITAVGPLPGETVEFYMNRPFVYYIMENSTGTILFMGRVNSL